MIGEDTVGVIVIFKQVERLYADVIRMVKADPEFTKGEIKLATLDGPRKVP